MDSEVFIKIVLIIIGLFVWLTAKASKKAKNQALEDTENQNAARTLEYKFVFEEDDERDLDSDDKEKIDFDREMIDKKETRMSEIEKTLIEKNENLRKQETEISRLQKIADSKKKYKLNKIKKSKKDFLFDNFEDTEISDLSLEQTEEIKKFDLDFTPENLLNGIIFKEILERRGRKNSFR